MGTTLLRGLLLMTFMSGCGVPEESSSPPVRMGRTAQAQQEDNGLAFNGLAFNGLAFNGLAFNGLAFNGLAFNGFSDWFRQDPASANLFMKYLVRCAVPAGQTRSFTQDSATYTWPGSLGLAPDWAAGTPATLEEQQTVSACLAALTNKYGHTVLVSVVGADARGMPIATSSEEAEEFSLREGCFFGNLFNGEGLFVGNDQGLLEPGQSSVRACALEGPGACAPALTHVGSCQQNCVADSTDSAFSVCYHEGTAYHALSTRLLPQEVATCGDGVCQFPEACGGSETSGACATDCGACPATE